MVYLTAFAYSNGNPYNAFRGVDQTGVICGIAGTATADYPYLYFTNPLADISQRLCVKTCPASTGSATPPLVTTLTDSGATAYDF